MTDHRAKSRQALIEKFLIIAGERIERLNNALMELEQDPGSNEAAALVMREIHTLKGEAKLMGFADVNLVAHKIEDLLVQAREEDFSFAPGVIDFILKGFDTIGYLLHKQAGSQPSAIDLGSFVAQVDRLLTDRQLVEETPTTPPEAEVSFPLGAEAREEISIRVDVKKLDEITYLVGDLLRHQLQTSHSFAVLHQIGDSWRRDLQEIQTRLASHALPIDASRQQLEQFAQHARQWLAHSRALHDELSSLVIHAREESAEGGDLLDELEGTVKEVRLLPLSSIFGRYPRAVRDLAKEQSKRVKLYLTGGELQVDKQVLEKIGEPLLHLVRNAVDHGIEPPAEREAAGKAPEGRIELCARQAGAHVEITVSDDGRGIVAEEVREAAATRGLLGKAEAEELDQEDLIHLIFQPGLSTREYASEISGRGIGLDVVKDGVENLGGSVRVQSRPGLGTSVLLDVPIFVALMRGLVVGIGQAFYAIPSFAVAAVTDAIADRLEPAGAGMALRLDDGLVPLQDLGALLGQQNGHPTGADDRIVVIQSQGRRLGLRVEQIVGERELVQRPLDPFVKALPLLIGTAVHEHAELAFVLNVSEIMQSSLVDPGQRVPPALAGTPVGERCVLLVEDSELTRDMLEGMLRGLGHRVVEAANGRDALERARSLKPDLVVTDLEMPVMDGFELIAQIRATPALQEVPIVVLTTRGSEADRQRAAALGADAYLVKAEFGEEAFTTAITRFLGGRSEAP